MRVVLAMQKFASPPAMTKAGSPRAARVAPHWSVGAGLLGSVGTLPRPSWGGEATVGLGTRAFSLALEARVESPATLERSAGSVTLWLATAWLVPCVHLGALAACGVVGGGTLRGSGGGVDNAHAGAAPWVGAGLRAAARVPLSRSAALSVHVDAFSVPLQTVVLLGDPGSDVWKTPRVAASLGVGIVYDFRPLTDFRATIPAASGQ